MTVTLPTGEIDKELLELAISNAIKQATCHDAEVKVQDVLPGTGLNEVCLKIAIKQ